MGRRARALEREQARRRGGLLIIVALCAALGIAIAILWAVFGPRIQGMFASPEDYSGAGSGEVVVRIEPGWNGTDVATMLESEDVVADAEVFTDLLIADPSISLQPGAYRLANQMSSQSALDALLDPANKVELRVTVPEGFMIQQVYARLAESTGIAEAEFVQAGANAAQFGLPAGAPGLEGWLFPATYTFDQGATATQILQTMVDRMREALVSHGVPESDWQRVVTFASLVQREAGPVENFGKVARVFQNRLDIGMKLQSDATVAYGTGNTHLITTTDAERGDAGNPYNTYIHPGLPIGPIGAPGDAAIQSVLNPEPGDWLFFVTTNPDTGETVFSETLAQHNEAVLIFQAWLRDNPEYGG